jgi:IS1 family transposase
MTDGWPLQYANCTSQAYAAIERHNLNLRQHGKAGQSLVVKIGAA